MKTSEFKNSVLAGLTAERVVRPKLTDETFPVIEEMNGEGTIRIIWDETGNTEKENVITFQITNFGRDFYHRGGY